MLAQPLPAVLPYRVSMAARKKAGRLKCGNTGAPAGLAFAFGCLLAACIFLLPVPLQAASVQERAAALQAHYAQLRPRLESNQFGRPLQLESVESKSRVQGDVHALLDHPIALLNASLSRPEAWCDVLVLHINVKYCRVHGSQEAPRLRMKVGRKEYQDLPRADGMDFSFRLLAAGPNYFEAQLDADEGPLGTRDYSIVLSAVPVGRQQVFLNLSYSYGFGALGSMAMAGYLNTRGRDKVGFSSVAQADGQAQLVKGFRGLVERNAMRYYLAIDAYLDAQTLPPLQRQEARLLRWFRATEQYPRQLHEMDEEDYLDIKRREIERQQRTPPQSLE